MAPRRQVVEPAREPVDNILAAATAAAAVVLGKRSWGGKMSGPPGLALVMHMHILMGTVFLSVAGEVVVVFVGLFGCVV